MIAVNHPNFKWDFHCSDGEESMEITELMAAATLDVDMDTTEASDSRGNTSDNVSDHIDDFSIFMTDRTEESASRGVSLHSDFSQLSISANDHKGEHFVLFDVLRNISSDSRSKSETPSIVEEKKFIKRPLNHYMEWTVRKRSELSMRYPSKNAKEISIELGKIWRSMDMAVKKSLKEEYQRRFKLLKQQGAKFKPYKPVGEKMKKEKFPVNKVNKEIHREIYEVPETKKDKSPQQKEETEKLPEQDDHPAEFRIDLIEEYHSYMYDMRQIFGY
ncbi:hypothetical protein CRE_15039 [Caenorhabditis remanei]|uniref:HMG box domain-containing protein n=1 Tax=Caenorhabditis remanei TaxID=31234 RepID=E3NKA4_CAERE|nr:hypothetical protein CRE_15039 [Caenorhabditis remanei]